MLNKFIRLGKIRVLNDSDDSSQGQMPGTKTSGDFRLKEGDQVVTSAAINLLLGGKDVSGPVRTQKFSSEATSEESAEREFDAGKFAERAKELKNRQAQKAREWIQSMVIYEDDSVVGLNKPAGIVSAQGGDEMNSIEKALKAGWPEERWLIHRLDKDTTGLLLVAKSRRIAAFLHEEFKERRVTKTYWALVSPVPKETEGRIKAPLFIGDTRTEVGDERSSKGKQAGKKKQQNDLHESSPEEGGNEKMATTEFTVLEKLGKHLALVSLNPLTGRKHQLRVHAASVLGSPIVGDFKYGPGVPESIRSYWPMKEEEPGLCLHAKTLHFAHPSIAQKYLTIRAPLPLSLTRFMRRLGFQTSAVLDQLDKGATKVQLDHSQWKTKKLADKASTALARQKKADGPQKRPAALPGKAGASQQKLKPWERRPKPLVPLAKLSKGKRREVVIKFAKKAAMSREQRIKTAWLKRQKEKKSR